MTNYPNLLFKFIKNIQNKWKVNFSLLNEELNKDLNKELQII